MKLAIRYSRRHIPIEIEIEDAALTPNMIPNVLGSILEQLNSWIDTVLFKSDVKSGVCAVQEENNVAR